MESRIKFRFLPRTTRLYVIGRIDQPALLTSPRFAHAC